MNKNLIVVLILVVLVVVSAIQAVQLTGLKSKIESSALKLGSSSKTPHVTAASSSSSGNLEELPSMVGGC